ncbi:MAG TPA: ParA family protein [Pyrinomonadaceae bacterium]|jgi:chromosome partitioning protein|nr:ParA family protein [Pyrinomonadaceae bacterium]
MSTDASADRAASKDARIIAVVNQKGGVGKTTSVVNIGAGLALRGRKVLLVDLDAQAHLTYSLGIKADELEATVYDLLNEEAAVEEVLIEKGGVAVIPSSVSLTGAEFELSGVAGREALLKNVLAGISGYDFILLDCPPNLGLLTLNALTAAKEVFVPLQAEYLAIKGLNNLREMAGKVKERLNAGLEITGVLVTLFDQRLKLYQEVLESLRAQIGDELFETVIRRNVALAEATSFGQSIFEYAPHSKGAEDYRALCEEILGRGPKNVEEKTA